ncbi:MAG: CoA transferase [Myxococcales bacterium]|nr:CoA transferase [Myxococcales bacterium]
MTYSLLSGVRVLELSLLAPDLLGMHLADLGADVIKIEQPPRGDYVRELGAHKAGGVSFMHLRWNRSKRSLTLDCKQARGRELLHRLATGADVVIDGLRAGAAERCGAGYDELRALQPAIVYCSLSGTGRRSPYAQLATHGVAYDAFAGLAPPVDDPADGEPRIPPHVGIGMHAAPLYAGMAVCAALVRARTTGVGSCLDIAELDASVAWQAEALAGARGEQAPGRVDLSASVRYQYYRTADERVVLFQASERKFWRNFCDAVGRPDLFEAKPGDAVGDHARGDEELRRELAQIFRTRTRDEWIALFLEADVPGAPVYPVDELPDDPHVKERALLIEQDHPVAGSLRLFSTPIHSDNETFSTTPAPAPGEHNDEILSEVLGLSRSEIAHLRAEGVV